MLDFERKHGAKYLLVLLPVVVLPDVVALLAGVVAALDEAEVVAVDPEAVEAPDVDDTTELEPELERAGPPVIWNLTE